MRELSVKINLAEQAENAMNPEGTIFGNDVPNCSEEERKVTWMRETRVKLFVQMGLEACRFELDWLLKYAIHA